MAKILDIDLNCPFFSFLFNLYVIIILICSPHDKIYHCDFMLIGGNILTVMYTTAHAVHVEIKVVAILRRAGNTVV